MKPDVGGSWNGKEETKRTKNNRRNIVVVHERVDELYLLVLVPYDIFESI
jgi:hypothetical protein